GPLRSSPMTRRRGGSDSGGRVGGSPQLLGRQAGRNPPATRGARVKEPRTGRLKSCAPAPYRAQRTPTPGSESSGWSCTARVVAASTPLSQNPPRCQAVKLGKPTMTSVSISTVHSATFPIISNFPLVETHAERLPVLTGSFVPAPGAFVLQSEKPLSAFVSGVPNAAASHSLLVGSRLVDAVHAALA